LAASTRGASSEIGARPALYFRSGDPTPSPDDRAVTRQIAAAGQALGIPVLDHVILGDGRFCSLAEEGPL